MSEKIILYSIMLDIKQFNCFGYLRLLPEYFIASLQAAINAANDVQIVALIDDFSGESRYRTFAGSIAEYHRKCYKIW